ncbi:MAG: DUF6922 domain-containing protein [Parcubacteria group bacterium]
MNKKNNQKLKEFKPFLWSYDIDKLDLERDKRRIITNVLNLGTERACNSLFKIYDKNDIKKEVLNPLPGEWNDKSLNYWSIIFNIKPKKTKNVLRNIR